jgi:hypothetical protein
MTLLLVHRYCTSSVSETTKLERIQMSKCASLTPFILSSFRKFRFTPGTATDEKQQVCASDNIEEFIDNSPLFER